MIDGTGALHIPNIPNFPDKVVTTIDILIKFLYLNFCIHHTIYHNHYSYLQKDKFIGESFHSAQWKTDFNPKEKSIGVIGTGASAVQAIPYLAMQGVKELVVFQRTACW